MSASTQNIFTWEQLTTRFPLVHLLQPDFYMIFRLAAPDAPVYQQNLNLDLGPHAVSYDTLARYIVATDGHHVRRMDQVMGKFAIECRLEPFDFICSIILRWEGPDASTRYFIRKTTLLKSDARGLPCYGIMSFQDVTALISAIKPNNVDVTFLPEKASLCYELTKRINDAQPKSIEITVREKEVVRCLYKGMSSKEIANTLFISKATVDTHRQNLIRKWDVPNTAAILKRALDEGVV
jgi:DNA-binding CsgD family transcriptional regulator